MTPTPAADAPRRIAERTSSRSVYGPLGRSPWLDIDWREHQQLDDRRRSSGQRDRAGRGPPLVFVHGLSGSWPNWLEQLPVFAADHRVIALDLPGFGHSPMPREPISISGYARTLDALLRRARRSTRPRSSATRWAASSRPSSRSPSPSASSAWCSSRPRDSAPTTIRARPARCRRCAASSASSPAYAGWVASQSDTVARRPRLRNATLSLVARHPGRLPAALAAEQIRGAGKPGFMPGAAGASATTTSATAFAEIACPTLIVWGDDDRVITRARRRRASPS